jgi:hypothetical protein
MKFREYLSNGSRVVACVWTGVRMDRGTDRYDEDNGPFRYFAKVPKIMCITGPSACM